MTSVPVLNEERVSQICEQTTPHEGHQGLLRGLQEVLPDVPLRLALSRGGWYRMGGIVDGEGAHIADDLHAWAGEVAGDDLNTLLAQVMDHDWYAVRLQGTTHFFVGAFGDAPEDFVQVEVEELHEVRDHPLWNPDAIPEEWEDFFDPLDRGGIQPVSMGKARYHLRRIIRMSSKLAQMDKQPGGAHGIRRFLGDWAASSAGHQERFSDHWIITLRDDSDRYGSGRISAKPVSLYEGEFVFPKKNALPEGPELANLIHGLDHLIGHPFAWYFHMLTSAKIPHEIVERIRSDHQADYSYLPERDLQVLNAWLLRPYAL